MNKKRTERPQIVTKNNLKIEKVEQQIRQHMKECESDFLSVFKSPDIKKNLTDCTKFAKNWIKISYANAHKHGQKLWENLNYKFPLNHLKGDYDIVSKFIQLTSDLWPKYL